MKVRDSGVMRARKRGQSRLLRGTTRMWLGVGRNVWLGVGTAPRYYENVAGCGAERVWVWGELGPLRSVCYGPDESLRMTCRAPEMGSGMN